MRTIQEYLRECNRAEIIDLYISKHTSIESLLDPDVRELTIGEYIDCYRANIDHLIDNLVSAKPKKLDDEWILFVVHVHNGFDSAHDVEVGLASRAEIETEEDVKSYAYEFASFEEAASFYIADTYLTQFYIKDLIVDFLFEISWFGYDQEGLEEEKNKLIERSEKAKASDIKNCVTYDELLKALEDVLEKRDDAEEEAWLGLAKATIDYNRRCMDLEIGNIKDSLLQ